ncbi:MAG: peroxiredoxin [Mucispirillum sp.]|nr:peroxiredoxin [Mucispirillum sp.]
MLKKGDNAPYFELEGTNGQKVSSESLIGSQYVLYFYPKDNTSGCTKEAVEFSSLLKEFEELGIRIFGVSPDSIEKHNKFIKDHDLKITLLSDPENQASSAYFAYGDKSMYGKIYKGIIRSTFVINEDSIIEEAYYKVKAAGHAKKVLESLK